MFYNVIKVGSFAEELIHVNKRVSTPGLVLSVNLTVVAYSNNLLFEFFHDALV